MAETSVGRYDEFKDYVRNLYGERYNPKQVDKFIEFISSRYDKDKKFYLPHKVIWRIFDLQNKIERFNQHQVYGFFGRAGYGKTTLAKQVLYTHDPTFNQNRVATSMDKFEGLIADIIEMGKKGRFKAILIDEPSKEEHSASKKWRMTEDLLGQIRQFNLIIGVCATLLQNIKTSVYSHITGLYAFRKMFIYDYYDEEKSEGVTGLIWKKYKETKTYECFMDNYVKKKALINNAVVYRKTPLDHEMASYNIQKKREFVNKLRKLSELKKASEYTLDDIRKRTLVELNKNLREKGKKQIERAELLGLSRKTIYRYDESEKEKMRNETTSNIIK